MSTNKTQNYQLHAWVPGDDFLLSEFNANFAAIDGLLAEMPINKKLKIAVGSYLGDNIRNRVIELGFRPKAVALACITNRHIPINTICLDGVENYSVAVVDRGFAVSDYFNEPPDSTSGYVPGATVNPYYYMAFWWEE